MAKQSKSLFKDIMMAEDKRAEQRQVKSDVREITRAQSEGRTYWKIVYEQRQVPELVKNWRKKKNPGLKLAVAGTDKKAFKINGVEIDVHVTGSIMIRVSKAKAEALLAAGLVTEYPDDGDKSPF